MSTSVELRAAFSPTTADRGATLESIGISVLRYALVLIFVLFGALKFTAAEAAAIKPLVANSPLMSFFYKGNRPALLAGNRSVNSE